MNSLYAPFATGGAEATLQGLAEALVQRGWKTHVICLTPERGRSSAMVNGVDVHYEPVPTVMWPFDQNASPWRKALFQAIESYNPIAERRVRKLLEHIKPDVVHVHNFKGWSASIWRSASRLGIPVVQTLHDYTLSCPRSVMFKNGINCQSQCASCRALSLPRRLMRSIPTTYTAVSDRMVERMAATGAFPPRAAPTIIRGDNPEGLHFSKERPVEEGVLRFGFLGRLDPTKGVEILIKAASQLRSGETKFLIAGAGAAAYERELKALAAGAPDVTFLGRVEPKAFFEAIDILVVPSVWEEPLGRVVHEAFGFGTPVIASRIGGIPEIVDDGRTGLLIPAADPGALAQAIKRLVQTPALIPPMQANARAAAAPFSRQRIIDQYEAVLLNAAQTFEMGKPSRYSVENASGG